MQTLNNRTGSRTAAAAQNTAQQMGHGYLTIQATIADDALPVGDARVRIYNDGGQTLYTARTDANGNTAAIALTAPDAALTLDPNYLQPAYSVVNVDVEKHGFTTEHIHGVQILDTQTAILPVTMKPLDSGKNPITDEDIYIGPIGLLMPDENLQAAPLPPAPGATPQSITEAEMESPIAFETPESRILTGVFIPDYITVHLGIPTNSAAQNVRVRFVDYIKNMMYPKHQTLQRTNPSKVFL
ncbi:MAG: hypothetical protein FWG82_06945 [Oscillospiraceae bacterium]|nr:hypothetical protein [Oscillospiraceae bacterium]